MGKVFGCSEGTILQLFARCSRDFCSIMADCGKERNASSCDSVLTGELRESTYTTISSWLRCLQVLVGGLHTTPDLRSTPEFFTRYASWFLRMRIRMVLNVGMTNASRHRYLRLTAYELMLSWAGDDVIGFRSGVYSSPDICYLHRLYKFWKYLYTRSWYLHQIWYYELIYRIMRIYGVGSSYGTTSSDVGFRLSRLKTVVCDSTIKLRCGGLPFCANVGFGCGFLWLRSCRHVTTCYCLSDVGVVDKRAELLIRGSISLLVDF